jgi:hypothetical protein
MTGLVLPFLGGLAGSAHCVAMCGSLPLALAAGRPGLARHLLYNAGRLSSLVFLGALAGTAGTALAGLGPLAVAERVLAVVAGGLMVLIGLEMAGAIRPVTAPGARLVHRTLGELLGGVVRSPSATAPLALGVLNAFLPCQLIYAFASQAAATASAAGGAVVMLAFGLGTMPAMLGLGVGSHALRPWVRGRLTLVTALLVVLFGAITVARGLAGPALHHH